MRNKEQPKKETMTVKMLPQAMVVALMYCGEQKKADKIVEKYHLTPKDFGLEGD
jgi:6-phosphogluconolactonase/glucosamine-6-phosphate isomerase/deaminase